MATQKTTEPGDRVVPLTRARKRRPRASAHPGYLVLTGLEYRSAEGKRMKVLFSANVGRFASVCGQTTVRAEVRAGSLARCRFCRIRLRVLSLDEAFDRGVVKLADYSVEPSGYVRNDPESFAVDLDEVFWSRFKSRRRDLAQRRAESRATATKRYQDFKRSQDQRRGLQIVSA